MSQYGMKNKILNYMINSERKFAFKCSTIEEFINWKSSFIDKLKQIIALNYNIEVELSPMLIEEVDMETYTRKKYAIQTEKEVWMPFYILIPKNIKEDEKKPVMIALHGHGGGGKESVAGRGDIPKIKDCIEKYNYDYGVQLVKEGYVIFCPDARGFGERVEKIKGSEDILEASCTHLSNAAISIGQTLTGMFTWDLIRLIDHIETLTYCDANRIGVCGFSGGASVALWISIMDERIKTSVLSGYFHGYKDTILKTNLCSCNFIPNLWNIADMGDLGAIIAPRPLLIESGNEDRLNGERGIKDVLEQVEITRKAYKIFGKEDNLYHHIFNGAHRWDGSKTFEFLNKFL